MLTVCLSVCPPHSSATMLSLTLLWNIMWRGVSLAGPSQGVTLRNYIVQQMWYKRGRGEKEGRRKEGRRHWNCLYCREDWEAELVSLSPPVLWTSIFPLFTSMMLMVLRTPEQWAHWWLLLSLLLFSWSLLNGSLYIPRINVQGLKNTAQSQLVSSEKCIPPAS